MEELETSEHPFYSKERGWVPIGDIEKDDTVRLTERILDDTTE